MKISVDACKANEAMGSSPSPAGVVRRDILISGEAASHSALRNHAVLNTPSGFRALQLWLSGAARGQPSRALCFSLFLPAAFSSLELLQIWKFRRSSNGRKWSGCHWGIFEGMAMVEKLKCSCYSSQSVAVFLTQ